MLGEGQYGVVVKDQSNNNRARKKFSRMVDMIREVIVIHYLNDCPEVVNITAVKALELTMVLERWDIDLLRGYRKYSSKFTPGNIRSIIVQLLRGLVYIHSKEIIHGDIKPQNILINANMKVCFCDLGLSSLRQYARVSLTSPGYCRANTTSCNGHDMFSLAILILEMFDHQPLIPYRTPAKLRSQVSMCHEMPTIIKELIMAIATDDIRDCISATGALAMLGEKAKIPPLQLPEKNVDKVCDEEDMVWIRDKIGPIVEKYNIPRSRKCTLALINYFSGPSYRYSPNNYDIFIAVALVIYSAAFSNGAFTLELARELVIDKTYSHSEYLQVLTALITDHNFIQSTHIRSAKCAY